MTDHDSKLPPPAYFEERAALALLVPRAKLLAALADAHGPEGAAVPQGVVAWMTPEGDRVVTASTMADSRAAGGASGSSMKPYTVALVAACEAPVVAGPDTSSTRI